MDSNDRPRDYSRRTDFQVRPRRRCAGDGLGSPSDAISSGFSLLELLVVVVVVGALAALSLPRFLGNSATAKKNTCYTLKGNIEMQAQLWYRNKGTWPAANLSDLGADVAYFPEGIPTCPVTGAAYTLDAITHRVTGHSH